MRFVRYDVGGAPQWGIETDDSVYSLAGLPAGEPTLGDIGNPSYRLSVRRALDRGALARASPDEVNRLAPVPEPGKVVCAGLNYHDHAEEQDEEVPDKPLLFTKSPSAVTNPGAPVVHPAAVDQVDYEVELAAVIGRTASEVDAVDATEYVAGYTVLTDVSARDAQFDDGQFFRGKSYDTFAPMGPTLVAGDGFDPNAAPVELRVNGETRQSSTTEEFIFDVISTGTPGGVGIFRDPPDLLQPGDRVVAEIGGIGALENPVVAAE